jgi:hypothetical protein
MQMEEHNYQTLRNAIDRMPTHEPGTSVWDAIDRRLTSEETLDHAIAQLPNYAPPAAVWERIAEDLQKPAKVRRLRPAWIGAAAAAVVVFTVGAYLWNTQTPEPVEKVQVVYAETQKPTNAIKTDWDEDDAVMQEVVEAFAQKASYIKEADDQSLLSEWEELKNAKSEIKTMLAKYGNDADLIRTIAEIERQRSALVKQMATEI